MEFLDTYLFPLIFVVVGITMIIRGLSEYRETEKRRGQSMFEEINSKRYEEDNIQ